MSADAAHHTMRAWTLALALPITSAVLLRAAEQRHAPRPRLRAVGYYIALRATLKGSDEVDLFGATNLPKGSLLTVYVADYVGRGGAIITPQPDCVVIVGRGGLFRKMLRPRAGLSFRVGMICGAGFGGNHPRQPAGVVRVAGRHGERLGDPRMNPQLDGDYRVTILDALTVVTR